MIEWQIQSLGKKSSLTETPFTDGDEILCLLFSNAQGLWERADIHADDWGEFPHRDSLLGRWHRTFSSRGDSEDQKQKLLSAEEFFLSLFEDSGDSAPPEDLEALKHFLGLFLERKRVLRRLRRTEGDLILYLHVSTKNELSVPSPQLTPELVTQLQRFLDFLI
jgi:hypothetical protein